jgi:uncharacterized protein with GYD domain
MAKYLIEASYTAEGVKGLLKEGGSSRRRKVEAAVKEHKGTVEAFYYAFGKSDVFSIIDLPDAMTAAAFSMAINQSGAVVLRMHPLMTPEEIDKAVKVAVHYQAPGQ